MRLKICYRNFLVICIVYFIISLIFQYRSTINSHFEANLPNSTRQRNGGFKVGQVYVNNSELTGRIADFQRFLQSSIKNFQYSEDSLMFYGSQMAIHALFQRIFSQKIFILKMALIGGSTSVPHGIQANESFFNILCSKMQKSNISLATFCINLAKGATGSNFFYRCFDDLITIDHFDILFLEFDLNDASFASLNVSEFRRPAVGQSFEQVIRRALEVNPNLVVISLKFPMFPSLYNLPANSQFFPICSRTSTDEAHLALAKHYDFPIVTVHEIFCKGRYNFTTVGKLKKDLIKGNYLSWMDKLHSGVKVHQIMADFILNYFSRSMKDYVGNANNGFKPIISNISVPNRFYNSTRFGYDSQCLMEFRDVGNIKKQDGNRNWFSNGLKQKQVENGVVSMKSAHRDYLKTVDTNGSIEFMFDQQFRKPRCTDRGFQIKLAAAHVLHKFKTTSMKTTIGIQFDNSEQENGLEFDLPLVVNGFQPVYIQYFDPTLKQSEQFILKCYKSPISYLQMKLERKSNRDVSLFRLVAIIIEYQCC